MTSTAMSKLSACFLMLMMAMAALVVLPVANEGQTPGTNDISIPVLDDSLSQVPSATVKLTNVHTGEVVDAHYSSGFYFVATDASSGYYRVDVTAAEYYDSLGAIQFNFTGLASYTSDPVILTKFPTKEFTWNVTISPAQSGATVGFYDDTLREIVSYGTTDALGRVDVKMFDTTTLGSTFYLFVKASGYQMHTELVVVSSDDPAKAVSLSKAVKIVGLVSTAHGTAQNVHAYLLNDDGSIPWIARLLESPKATGSLSFDAYPNDSYILCVDADSASANVTRITVDTSDIILKMTLADQSKRTEAVDIVFDDDYRSFNLTLNTTWSYDEPFPGLGYNGVGSLRMQLDLNGNANGVVDGSEPIDFQLTLLRVGARDVTSNRLLVLNATDDYGRVWLASSALSYLGDVTGAVAGDVTQTEGIPYNYTCAYKVYNAPDQDPIPLTSPKYTMDATAWFDTAGIDHVCNITLMPGFELTQNSTPVGADVFVGGYTTVEVNPGTGSGTATARLWIEESLRPTARAGVVNTTASYAVMEDKNITKYIVKVGANVTLNGSASSDPNINNPLTYIWNFGDGSAVESTKNMTIVHMYTTASSELTVNLTVMDVAYLENWTTIKVVCDGADPRPTISVKDLTLNTTENAYLINQRESITFNATSSMDDVVNYEDGLGIIDHVDFDYDDGNKSNRIMWDDDQQNVSHSYERAGVYEVVLNVTDVVGHWKNTSVTVKVNDTTAPVGTFTVKNLTGGASLTENETVVFNATGTYDNLDNITDIRFSWNMGDGNYENGTGAEGYWIRNYTYHKTGTFTVTLNVSDQAQNYKKYPKVVTIGQSERPDLRVTAVSYDPDKFTEGKSGWIVVNITNTGSMDASGGYVVDFYVVKADGTLRFLGNTSTIFNGSESVSVVEVGGKVQVKFQCTFENKGTYIIKVNVTCDNQIQTNSYTVRDDNALVVKEAGWKKLALWGGVAAVIVLVPLALYLRGRWSKREKKGPRREKKEKEKGGEEEL